MAVDPLAHQNGELSVPALKQRVERGAVRPAGARDEQGPERGFQPVAGSGEQRVRVVAGHAEDGGDLSDLKPLPQLQLDQLLLVRAEPANGGAHERAQLLAFGAAADVGGLVGHVRRRVEPGG